MGFIRFLRDVVCAPYSIPIGLINGKKPLGMCSETTKKELNLSEVTSHNKAYSGRVGTQTEDVSSITQYEVLKKRSQGICLHVYERYLGCSTKPIFRRPFF